MRRMKKMTAMATAAALLAGVVSGCGGTGQQTGEAASQSEQTEQAAAGTEETSAEGSAAGTGEQVTLRFSWWGGDSRHEATLDCIEAFEAAYPNITIEAEYGGFDGYQDKISAALSGGTEADIIQIDQPWMATYMAQNPDFFVDIRQYEDVIDLSGFSEDFLNDFCVYNDKLVSLPTGTNAVNFLANQAVLDEAGIEFGDTITWDDFYEQGKKVNETDPEKYFINMDSGIFWYVTKVYLMQLTNRQLINEDYTIGYTVDEMEEAFAYTKKLYDDKVILPLEESMIFSGAPQDNPGWNNNMYGSWLNWSSTADQQQWGDNAVSLPYPRIEGTENSGAIVRPAQLIVVSSNSSHPEEAMLFLDFMFNQDEGILALKDSRSIPPTEHGRTLLEENGLIKPQASKAVELAMQDPGTPELDVPNTTEVSSAFNSVLEKMVYGEYDSPRAAAEDAYNLMTEMLETVKADQQ